MATERRSPRRGVRLAPWLIALALAGCGERDDLPGFGRRTIKVEEVPAPAMDAAKKALPQITFNEAWKNIDPKGQLHSYEIRGTAANGKIREVRVSPTGEVLEME